MRGINKSGEAKSAASIGVLVILIALFIGGYVIMLSPEDRDALLFNETDDDSEDSDIRDLSGDVILSQNPGLVVPEDEGKFKHTINPVDLYIKEEPEVIDLSNLLNVKKSLFSEKVETLTFNADGVEDVRQANLFFNAQESKGNLLIYLNGNKIFDSEVEGIGNVVLPVHILNEDNVLILKSSGIGVNIFGENAYTLTDVKLRLKYELVNTRATRNVILGASETGDGVLDYFLYCREAPQGTRMKVFVNDNRIVDEVVSCISAGRSIEIDKGDLLEGKENEILFSVDGGDFLVNDISLEVESETQGYIEYKFSITEDEYDELMAEKEDVVLYIEMSGDDERKATILINGYEFDIDTDEISYERDITRFVEEGNNYIRIIPQREFIIDSLEIVFE